MIRMFSPLAVALLFGCTDAPTLETGGATQDSADSSTTGRPALTFPPDAVDTDPSPTAQTFNLTPQPLWHTIRGAEWNGYGFDGLSPGPVLRAAVGDSVTVNLLNELSDPTTLHWHGMAVPSAMDGVEWMQTPVPAGAGFTYTFTTPEAGTFWYHPHVDTARQVDLGLYGMFVVTDPTEPQADADVALVFDAWDEFDSADGAADDHTPPDPSTLVWTVNGLEDPLWTIAPSSRVRARLLNSSNTSYLSLSWPGARLIGGDQGLLAAEGVVDGLLLAPGQRADLEVDAGVGSVPVTTALWSAAGGASFGDARRVLTVESGSEAPVSPLTFAYSAAAPTPDPGTTDLIYVFQGGAPDTDWLINGEAWPEVTVAHVAQGAEVVMEVRNLSATEHPFHLHGNRFEVLSIDNIAPTVQTWEDTINVPIRSVVRLRLPAENPGRWALHCHLLGHEEGGMMTELDVDAP